MHILHIACKGRFLFTPTYLNPGVPARSPACRSNPWAYITQALAVNEFTGPSWK